MSEDKHNTMSFTSPLKRKEVYADLMTPPQFTRQSKMQKTDISPQSHQTFSSKRETRVSPLNDIFKEMDCESLHATEPSDVCKVVEIVVVSTCIREGVAILHSWTVNDLIETHCCQTKREDVVLQSEHGDIIAGNTLASTLEENTVYYICEVDDDTTLLSDAEPCTTIEIIDVSGARVGLPILQKWLVSDVIAALAPDATAVNLVDDEGNIIAVETEARTLDTDMSYALQKSS